MNLKLHLLHSHIVYSSENSGGGAAYNEEQYERFRQDINDAE